MTHPNLTCLLSAHVKRPPYYLVFPYLDGATLGAALAAVPRVPTPHALWIARQAAEALQALHQHGWRHADVKPGNLWIAPDGHVTLLDLGLARRAGTAECDPQCVLAGTLAYAAPENFAALGLIEPASDVYSLGATLFQMLTGRLPFPDSDPPSLVAAHLQRVPPDPRELQPDVPEPVVRLLQSMLAKQPGQRPGSADLVRRLWMLEIDTFHERFGVGVG